MTGPAGDEMTGDPELAARESSSARPPQNHHLKLAARKSSTVSAKPKGSQRPSTGAPTPTLSSAQLRGG